MSKSKAACIADAAVASALDAHPLIGYPDSRSLRTSAWKAISKVLSRGHRAAIDETDMRVVEIEESGEILLSSGSGAHLVGAVDEVSWQVAP